MHVSIAPFVLLLVAGAALCLSLGCPSTPPPRGLSPSAPWRDGGLGCTGSPVADAGRWRLALPSPEADGVFDADLARDPSSARLWAAYSGVEGRNGSGYVSTHLAFSDDEGLTWCHAGIVNEATAVPYAAQPARVATDTAHWNHETPALVFDAAADEAERWRLVWHRYLYLVDAWPWTGDQRFEYGWLAQRTASTPEGLLLAPEQKLFSAGAYHEPRDVELWNAAGPGGTPKQRLDAPPDRPCLLAAEPSLEVIGQELFAVLFCASTVANHERDVLLLRLDRASDRFDHVGRLLSAADATRRDASFAYFNGADLVETAAGPRLLVTPVAAAHEYLGCLAFPVDVGTARVGEPTLDIKLSSAPGAFHAGACTFHRDSRLGVVVGEAYRSDVQFRLFATGLGFTATAP